jgi:hypothetical protein
MSTTQYIDGEICDSGLDWFGFTIKPGKQGVTQIEHLMYQRLAVAQARGEKVEDACPNGYVSKKAHGLLIGHKKDSVMVRVSGDVTNDVAKEVMKIGAEIKPLRLDAKVTTAHKKDDPERAQSWREAIRRHEAKSGGARKTTLGLIEGRDFGDSLTCGVRSSPLFFRLYDKSRESGFAVPGWRWRREVEAKEERALHLWDACKRSGDIQATAQSWVKTHVASFGIAEKWMEEVSYADFPSTHHKTTDGKLLRWMGAQVRKSFHRLLENGKGVELLTELQIDGHIRELLLLALEARRQHEDV